MELISNLPSIGRAIVIDFWLVGVRLYQLVRSYTLAFVAVGVELFPDVVSVLHRVARAVRTRLARVTVPGLGFMQTTMFTTINQRLKRTSEWYEDLGDTAEPDEALPSYLIPAALGIFLLGCGWFTLVMFWVG